MPYEDEQRSAADFDALRAVGAEHDLLDLARSQGRLTRELVALRARLQATIEERDQLASTERGESARLREAERRAADLRQETRRLRADLERVRGSRTFRVGRAVLHPTSLLRGSPSTRGSSATGAPPSTMPAPEAPATSTASAAVPGRPVPPEPGEDGTPGTADARRIDPRRLDPRGLVPPRAAGVVLSPEHDRVLWCAGASPVGTPDRESARLHRLVQDLRGRGIDVHVLVTPEVPESTTTDARSTDTARPSPSVRTVQAIDDVPYIHRPCPGLEDLSWEHRALALADATVREALRARPAAIHAAADPLVALPALIAARRLGLPFLLDVPSLRDATDGEGSVPGPPPPAGVDGLIAREADAVLARSPQIAEGLAAQGVERGRITVLPLALDGRYLAALPEDPQHSAAWGIRTDLPVIGALGGIRGELDPRLLLRASALLDERRIDHQLVLVGPRQELLPTDLPEAGPVHALPRRSLENLPQLLSMVDVVVLPEEEPQPADAEAPALALESMATMTPVLLPDVDRCRALTCTSPERTALYAPGDAESLAASLGALLEAPDLRRSLGRAARPWALDAHPWDAAVDAILEAHRTLAESSVHRSAAPSRTVDAVRVGLIADEFTTTTLSSSLTVIPLRRDGWRRQLAEESLDLVLVESAWEGNGGRWHRGVGAYGAEEHQDVRDLLATARERGIPTAFWNKEDPVHFERFRATAALCDHVFTTDADMIPRYLGADGAVTRTASSMPFFAQPALHNPLPTDRPHRPTVAYAGTYYGDRYPERSAVLYPMLATAARLGLTIYDRQSRDPDSPYRFPAELGEAVEAALPYGEVITSYTSHLAHLNADSVVDSPTMYSRRVVEVAASGGIVLSGPGRGVEETFGGLIPASSDPALWRLLLQVWAEDPVARVREAWRQMRAVLRSHTVDTAIPVMLRTIGIPIAARPSADYSLVLPDPSTELVADVAAQSRRPREVLVPGGASDLTVPLERAGISVLAVEDGLPGTSEWIGVLESPVPRTWFEDLLLASRFGDWSRIDVELADETSEGRTLASRGGAPGSTQGLVRASRVAGSITGYPDVPEALRSVEDDAVRLLVTPPESADPAPARAAEATGPHRTVLVAGHDLKFAGSLIAALRGEGHTVLVDRWAGHAVHDEQRSRALLALADVVFCEWGLGSAVWYSHHVEEHQRLVVRIHLQELDRPFLRRIRTSRVDRFVAVGELVRRATVELHGIPAERTTVVPNAVDVEALDLPKHENSAFHLGFVGMVPQRKRLDLAVDLLERLLAEDPRYRLFVKGRLPGEHAWMADRPDELAHYDELSARIAALVEEHPGAVQFDPHGEDMPEWFRKIGIAVSVSDVESFHFTLADGAASGALPAALAWPGADELYPREWLSPTVEEMARSIIARRAEPRTEAQVVRERFAQSTVLPRLLRVILEERP